jgi:hypothetical protein
MFSFSPDQRLVEHILVDISWIMVGNYGEKKKKKVILDEKMGKVVEGKKKERERKEKKSVPLYS